MKKVFVLVRTTSFLVVLCAFLFTTTIGSIIWGVQTAATLTAATSTAVAKAVMKTKAKARIRRAVVAIPVVGLGAVVYFEERNYRDWLEDNPDGTRQEYGCEVVDVTAEVTEEVLQELPEGIRPEAETVMRMMPRCEQGYAEI